MKVVKADNIDFDVLKGFDKAAILINYVGPSACTNLFKYLDDGDIRKLIVS